MPSNNPAAGAPASSTNVNPRPNPEQTGLWPGVSSNFRSTSRNKRPIPAAAAPPLVNIPEPVQYAWDEDDAIERIIGSRKNHKPITNPNRMPPPELVPHTAHEEDYRHRDWRGRRRTVLELMLQGMSTARRNRFECCGARARVLMSTDGQRVKVVACKCRDRWCDPCRFEAAGLVKRNLRDELFKRRRGRARVMRKITISLRSTEEDLSVLKKRLFRCFKNLRDSKFWKSRTVGGVAFFEATLNRKTGQWHPHLHIIHEGDFLPHDELRAAWLKITGDSSIVFLSAIGSDEQAAAEAAKYASKGVTSPEDDPNGSAANIFDFPEKLREAMSALQGLRLCTTFGSWRGFRLTHKEKPTDEGWRDVGRLDEVIAKATQGELWAKGILIALDRQRPSYAKYKARDRSPPPD